MSDRERRRSRPLCRHKKGGSLCQRLPPVFFVEKIKSGRRSLPAAQALQFREGLFQLVELFARLAVTAFGVQAFVIGEELRRLINQAGGVAARRGRRRGPYGLLTRLRRRR